MVTPARPPAPVHAKSCKKIWPQTGEAALRRACHHSQSLLRRPFCEALIPHPAAGADAIWQVMRPG